MRSALIYVGSCLTFLLLAAAKPIAVVPFEVIVNCANAKEAITTDEVRDLLLGNVRTWPNQRRVTLVHATDSSPVFEGALRSILRMSGDEYQRHLLALEFRGGGALPIKVMASEAAVCTFVFNAPGSLGLVSPGTAKALPCASQIKVLPIAGKR